MFVHAFCRCDTKSCINRHGKTQIIGKLSGTPELRDLADNFYNDDTICDTIGEFSVRFFLNIFHHQLEVYVHFYLDYENKINMNMLSRVRSTIDPSHLLPPPTKADCFLRLRVYQQILVLR